MAFSFVRAITVNHGSVSGSNNQFTVLLQGTFAWMKTAANGGQVQNTVNVTYGTRTFAVPADLFFTSDSAGQTPVTWEFESYDATTGTAVVWVKLVNINATTDVVFYAFYGDASINTFHGGSLGAAWNSAYLGIWHLPDGSTIFPYDSTANTDDGSASNVTSATGVADGGGSFNGSDSIINMGADAVLRPSGAVTIEGWVIPATDGQPNFATIAVQEFTFPRSDPFIAYKIGSNFNGNETFEFEVTTGGSGHMLLSGVPHVADTPYYVVGVYDGTTQSIYVNGTLANSQSVSGTISYDAAGRFSIGANSAAGEVTDGVIDEVRVSNVARSADWIATQYSMMTAGGFLTVGNATPIAAGLPKMSFFDNYYY